MNDIYEILNELRPEFDFSNSKDFISDGFLDSFDIITLVTELEEKFDILIDALDIIPENFCNVEAIAHIVQKSGGTI
ncbi:acyl carrier protein [Tissierella sp.]|uniref:acyl carrier protein n=1 Tax=Tissierella sp. TaxID=41274 RepID=UPI0030618208